VRAALGASRGRIAADLLLESVILGLLGSTIGLESRLCSFVVLSPASLRRDFHAFREIGIDVPVLLFTLLISLLASILFGSLPIFKYAGVRLSTGIREGGPSAQPKQGAAASRAKRFGGCSSRACARPAHLLGIDDSHFPCAYRRQSRILRGGDPGRPSASRFPRRDQRKRKSRSHRRRNLATV